MWFLIFTSCLALALANPEHIHYDSSRYHGPNAPLDKVGRVIDTPEVAHAKAAHFLAYHAEAARNSHHSYAPGIGHSDEGGHHHGAVLRHVTNHYHGPSAPLAHDGTVIDTPEVAFAKSAHFHAHQEELSKISHLP